MERLDRADDADEKPKLDPSTLEQDRQEAAGKGKVGSLENPEVYEDVPGHVIPILEREFDDFDTEAAKFLARRDRRGQVHRLPPQAGRLRPAPARRADDPRASSRSAASRPSRWTRSRGDREKYAPLRKGHITTRQNIQFHHIPLARRREGDPRDRRRRAVHRARACGNTVRNVTGDPWAGVREDEPFDITPYAVAYVRYFVRHPVTQLMPRKFKTAFTATDEDRAITGIHDLGFIPKLREIDGERCAGSRSGSAAAPRSCPASPPRLTSSSSSTTAST